MAIVLNGTDTSDSDGTLVINNDYIFDSTTERDTYFTSAPDELIEDLYCVCDGTLYKYVESVWDDVSAIIQGSTGDNGYSVSVQYSDDDSTWHDTLVTSADTYIRFSVDNGITYTDGVQFVGEDGLSAAFQYSEDGSSWHDTANASDDLYIRASADDGVTYTDGFKFIGTDGVDGEDLIIQYSQYGDSDWSTEQTDSDSYWRWSIDGGTTWSNDFVRYSADVNVDIATVADVGIVKPDGTTIVISEDGTISTDVAAATKVVVADETEMLALTEISNLYIATRTDLEQIWYLNAGTDPSVLANWSEGASVADTVASFTGASGTPRTGAVEATTGDYNLDMVQTEDTSTGTTYYLEVTDGTLYLVEV